MGNRTSSHRSSRSGRRRPTASRASGSDGFSATSGLPSTSIERTSFTSNTDRSDISIDPGLSPFRSQPHSALPRHPSLPYRHQVPDTSPFSLGRGICPHPGQHQGFYAMQSPKATDYGSPADGDDSAISLIVSPDSPASSPRSQWSAVVDESQDKERRTKHGERKKNHKTESSTAPAAARTPDRMDLPSTQHVEMGGPPSYNYHQDDGLDTFNSPEYQTLAPTPPMYDPNDLSYVGAASWDPIVFPYPPDLVDADLNDSAD